MVDTVPALVSVSVGSEPSCSDEPVNDVGVVVSDEKKILSRKTSGPSAIMTSLCGPSEIAPESKNVWLYKMPSLLPCAGVKVNWNFPSREYEAGLGGRCCGLEAVFNPRVAPTTTTLLPA